MALPLRRPSTPREPAPHAPHAPPPAGCHHAECHYCGSVLPRGRAVVFCPYCGQDLTVRQCPACSAELDLGWRFCVCCGRGVDTG